MIIDISMIIIGAHRQGGLSMILDGVIQMRWTGSIQIVTGLIGILTGPSLARIAVDWGGLTGRAGERLVLEQ